MTEPPRPSALLFVLFGISGVAALIYQTVWQRFLFTTFGTNSESVTIVIAAFMLGLGLGSLAGGELSKRSGIPLVTLFALAEAGIAVFGFLSADIFEQLNLMMAGASLPVVGLASFVTVVVPTTLMGATLPLLVAHCVKRDPSVGRSLSLLYFANTLGSGAACFLAIWLLLPQLGLRGATYAAAAMNFLVAIYAYYHFSIRNEGAPR